MFRLFHNAAVMYKNTRDGQTVHAPVFPRASIHIILRRKATYFLKNTLCSF